MEQPLNPPYDVGELITLRGLFLTGSTQGSIIRGQTLLLVRDESGLALSNGDPIFVQGGGAVGGDLVTSVVSHSGAQITLALPALSNVTVGLVGTPTNPTTVSCKVQKPDGSEATLTPTSSQAGVWDATYTPSLDGEFFYRFAGTGAATADGWRKFVVRPERVS